MNAANNGNEHEPIVEEHVEGDKIMMVNNGKQNNETIIVPKKNISALNDGCGASISQPINVTTNQERDIKTTRLGACGIGTFKGKTSGKYSNSLRTTRETLVNLQGVQLEEFVAAHFNKVNINGGLFQNANLGHQMGLKDSAVSNVTRPPDRENAPLPNSSPHTQRGGNMAQEEGEEFLDAMIKEWLGPMTRIWMLFRKHQKVPNELELVFEDVQPAHLSLDIASNM
ncbi:hypothetical protein TSUD_188850 [Trifolium subterraneum]|uniref:Uncharacterized protein n=1 Tax=Trifolium subterraneum TaxID=3900 RepID=A0A2Z6NWN5_TRISU|nr:hypothetical protein TSUD_188850 [Trifolium subterraneum]